MDDHIHTGFVTFVTVGVYAVLFIWGVRLVAAQLADKDGPLGEFGKALGGTVHFA